jgi:hypothetical protein
VGRRGKLGIPIVVAIVVLAGALLSVAPSLYEVRDKGRDLVPYDGGLVYEIRLADTATVYADGDSRTDPDMVTGVALAALSAVALMTFLLLSSAGRGPDVRRFYGLTAAGLAFLSADELLSLHETVGHNLQFLRDVLPAAGRPDDVIVMAYAIPAVAFLMHFRDVLFATRRLKLLVGASLALFAISAVGDARSVPIEEPAELAASVCAVAAVITLVSGHLATTFGLPWTLPLADEAPQGNGRRVASAPAETSRVELPVRVQPRV